MLLEVQGNISKLLDSLPDESKKLLIYYFQKIYFNKLV